MAAPRAGGWRATYGLPFVIGASSAGTIIEWYDFYLYATLTPFLAPIFFPSDNPTASLLAAFATYAAGFLVRPFGAVVFGRIGDVVGRKYAFLMTISIMGVATVIVGLLPTYASIGILAPTILLVLRLAQGLALGGEYGGAAIYVAEHAPDHRRGFYTAWIQTTATIGFFLALAVILIFRTSMTPADFASTGWRYPFLISAILLAIAIYIRMRLQETPLFARLKARGETTKDTASWAKDSFSGRKVGTIALVLLGLTAGQGVWIQVIFVTMVYGPIAAFLVEYFRAKVRYTSLSIPYHFGNGWFGGLLPLFFTGLVGATFPEGSKFYVPWFKNFMSLPIDSSISLRQFNTTNDPNGNIYLGLAYVIVVALMSVVIGTLFLKEPKGVKIWSEVGGNDELAPGLVGESTPAD